MVPRRVTRSAPFAVQALGLAVVASLALLATGCGGNSSAPPVASLAATHSTTTAATVPPGGSASGASGSGGQSSSMNVGSGGTKFSACMRSHGVPNFPDPNSQGELTFGSSDGIDPSSPQFQSAQRACQKLLPQQGTPSPARQAKMQAQALKFSACMRSHGVPKFPDPTFSGGGIGLRIDRSSGIDPGSPQFQAAQTACQNDLPGRPGSKQGAGAGGATTPSKQGAGSP
jgi:hypothetical protein